MTEPVFWIAPIAAIVAMIFAWRFFKEMRKRRTRATSSCAPSAAMCASAPWPICASSTRSCWWCSCVVAGLFAFLAYGLQVQNPWLPVTFVFGGFFSALAGYFGMQTATLASTRTTAAARDSLATRCASPSAAARSWGWWWSGWASATWCSGSCW
jgi:K(+)-stimulated pyrophosphate-energized sodium pump